MSYFNYHAKIKKLIKENQLSKIVLLNKYNNISPCMLLIFKSNKPMPVREYRWQEYFDYLSSEKIIDKIDIINML